MVLILWKISQTIHQPVSLNGGVQYLVRFFRFLNQWKVWTRIVPLLDRGITKLSLVGSQMQRCWRGYLGRLRPCERDDISVPLGLVQHLGWHELCVSSLMMVMLGLVQHLGWYELCYYVSLMILKFYEILSTKSQDFDVLVIFGFDPQVGNRIWTPLGPWDCCCDDPKDPGKGGGFKHGFSSIRKYRKAMFWNHVIMFSNMVFG